MLISEIVKRTNKYLAGEHLTYDAMVVYLDEVVDDINTRLCAKFPVVSEAVELAIEDAGEPVSIDVIDYDYFPNQYIRNVLCKGAAYKFYIQDEEGALTAAKFGYDYDDKMFLMERDYLALVPIEYQAEEVLGSVVKDEFWRAQFKPFRFNQFGD